MALIRWLCIWLILSSAPLVWAQAPAPGDDAKPVFVPPRAHSAEVPYPSDAPPHTEPIVVTVKLVIDPSGAVTQVDLVSAPQPVFDDAVIAAARGFRFDPATSGGQPVAVELTFTHKFLPPPPVPEAPVDGGPARSAVLRGKLIELGTRVPVGDATVTASVGERTYAVDVDRRGHFALPLPAGASRITVTSPGHNTFLQAEQLVAGQALAVTYLIERDRYDPYEIVVLGDARREEVSRIALRGAEIKQLPGTFGDPFRVVQALPGVATIASLLPFPIVRGSSPAATGISIDGTRIPLLYHLGAGPSVVHPELIDEIDFYPGGAPVSYGGHVGGIVDGRTRRARADERLIDVDINLLQAGALVREPIPALGVTATVAGRYGYPGFLLGQVSGDTSLSYWDYQLRLDGGTANHGFTVFAFGARDELDELRSVVEPEPPQQFGDPPTPKVMKPALILGFHRLDLRGHHRFGDFTASARTVLGFDESFLHEQSTSAVRFWSWIAEPSLKLEWRPSQALRATLGIEGSAHRTTARIPSEGEPSELLSGAVLRGITRSYLGSAVLDAVWRPTDDWLIRGGVRGDVYADRDTTLFAADPRLTVRYRLARRDLEDVPPDSDDSSIWIKGSTGVYHQPARYLVPIPGLDQLPLSYGLLRSIQSSLGIEIPLPDRFEITAEGYYNSLDPTFFELSVPNDDNLVAPGYPVLFPNDQFPRSMDTPYLDQFAVRERGRAYGLETLIRRRSSTGVYGWASYTLSLSERLHDGRWQPYDFDRTHMVNLVAGIPLGRNWDLGLRLQYQTGKPQPVLSDSFPRNAPYARFDIRFDKHAVWRSWIFDFYVDVTNAAVMPEELRAGEVLRYALPSLGMRGRF